MNHSKKNIESFFLKKCNKSHFKVKQHNKQNMIQNVYK